MAFAKIPIRASSSWQLKTAQAPPPRDQHTKVPRKLGENAKVSVYLFHDVPFGKDSSSPSHSQQVCSSAKKSISLIYVP